MWLPATTWALVPAARTRPAPPKRLMTRPRTVDPLADTTSPAMPAAVPLPSSSTTGAPVVAPGCVLASMTSAAVTEGSAVPTATRATPPVNRLTALRRPGAALPLPIMNTRCSMPALRPACARPASPPSALALSSAWRRLPWPLPLALVTVPKLKPKSTPVTLLPTMVTGATACAVPLSPAL
jgi:hypothetical protein